MIAIMLLSCHARVYMEEQKYVSIVIPVFNADPYLEVCLSSICAQTYPYYKVIIIDDGSTDRSGLIAAHFAEQDSRFSVHHTENGGVSKARNLGISLSCTDYLCFIDADDYVEPAFLEHLMSEIGDADICVSAKRRWDQCKNKIRCDRFPAFRGSVTELTRHMFPYLRAMRGVTGRIFSGALFRDASLRFDESLDYGEDMKLNYAAFCLAENVVFCSEPLYTYRIHNPLSLSRQNSVKVSTQSRNQEECIRMLKDQKARHSSLI